MGIRDKTDELAHHQLWDKAEPSLGTILRNIDEIASEQRLWCRNENKKRLALSRGTKAVLKKLRELKGKAVVNGPLSEEESAELARTKTEARRKYLEETRPDKTNGRQRSRLMC
ncbi:MAG: uncharacterized protein A8A55_1851 [Amphiamblys sp. WSBS2006]|nr:MAG: uncharacterized protein A8A55_1851 [Amphiamblys sp. WSBS2006]